jgi:hypothetical protein
VAERLVDCQTDKTVDDRLLPCGKLRGRRAGYVRVSLLDSYRGLSEAEHLLCLNRGPSDTGPDWFVKAVADLAGAIVAAQSAGSETATSRVTEEKTQSPDSSAVRCPLDLQVWWGWKDGMVPRKGQREPSPTGSPVELTTQCGSTKSSARILVRSG